MLQDGLRPDLGDAFGDVLMAAGHLAWAIYTLGAKSLLERHDAVRVSLAAVALTLPPLAPARAAANPSIRDRALPALVLGVRARVRSRPRSPPGSWNWALHRTRAGTMGVFDLRAARGRAHRRAIFALGERTGPLALIGAALILGGVALEVRRRG